MHLFEMVIRPVVGGCRVLHGCRTFVQRMLLWTFLGLAGVAAGGQSAENLAVAAWIGRGINLGNTLEANHEGWWDDPANENMFADFAAAGFDSVRIPVRWGLDEGESPWADPRADTNAPYAIPPAFMNRVQEVVDWALKYDLVVILNSHHDHWIKTDPGTNEYARFYAIWEQVSDRFKDYSDGELIFEIINEPYHSPAGANLTHEQCNDLQDDVLAIIRASNPTRYVVYSGNSYGMMHIKDIRVPDDPYIIATFHNYDPYWFVQHGRDTTWGTPEQIQGVKENMDEIEAWAVSNNVPVFMGEFAVTSSSAERASELLWYETQVREAVNRGFGFHLWDAQDLCYDDASRTWDTGILDKLMNYGSWPGETPGRAPYGGMARTLPGVIQAEDFDEDDAGGAYADTTAGNAGNAYRTGEDVDIESTGDAGGGYNVGWTVDGEWLEYTVDVTEGVYDLHVRTASVNSGRQLRVLLDGSELAVLDVPNTTDWQTYETVTTPGISLEGGTNKILRVEMIGGGFNINWIEFKRNRTPQSMYESWLAAFPTVGRTNIGDNLYFYAVGANPTNPASAGNGPQFQSLESGLEYVHFERRDAEERGLVYTVETCGELTEAWTNGGLHFVGSGELDAEFNAVTNRLPTQGTHGFIRLNIEFAP